MPQPKLHWSAHLWPGLPQLWTRGSWVALGAGGRIYGAGQRPGGGDVRVGRVAAGQGRWAALVALAIVWLLAWLEGRADWRRLLAELSAGEAAVADPTEQSDRWFREAQAAYLAGDWVSAEQTLLKLLKHDPRDAEARLMLATLWRHEGRPTPPARNSTAWSAWRRPRHGGTRSPGSANEFAPPDVVRRSLEMPSERIREVPTRSTTHRRHLARAKIGPDATKH